MTSLTIDCDECAHQHTETCAECVVTFICSAEVGQAVVIDATERLALRRMTDIGLLPRLHHQPRSG
jgi:hypothetical protein